MNLEPTGAETWSKVGTDVNDVDIGYHHNRIDRYLGGSTTFSGSSASLTINPGVVVAIGGQYGSLGINTAAAFHCVGEPLADGYDVITNRLSSSMLIESPKFAPSSNPSLTIFSSTSDDLEIRSTKFIWLAHGIHAYRTIPGSISDNIFILNKYGVMSEGCPNTLHNNLFYRSWAGICGWHFDAVVSNNTFDSNVSGIYYLRWSGSALFATDNLFTQNDRGISLYWQGDAPHYNYNAFYGNSSNIYDYDLGELDVGPQSRDLVSSPYHDEEPGCDAKWFLKQTPDEGEIPEEVLAVDCGSQSALTAALDEKTTSVYLKPDTGIVDIGWHQPIDEDRDSDSDSMPDWWEDLYDLDPQDPADAYSDADEDSVYAFQEYQGGTNPGDDDSDHDGVPDGEDAAPGGRTDTDGDGMTDDWETYYLGSTSQGADEDPDADGLTNWEEWNLDTDPSNPDTDSDGIADGYDKDPNGPKLTIVSLMPPKTATDDLSHPALVTSCPVFRLEGIADARLRNVEVFVNNRGGSNPGYAAIIEPSKFEMKYVPLGDEGTYDIMVKAYDFDGNKAFAFTQVEVSYSAPAAEAWIEVHEAVVYDRNAEVWAAFGLPDGATPISGHINGVQDPALGDYKIKVSNLALQRGANRITACLIYSYGGGQYQITDTGTVYFHMDSPAYDQWYSYNSGTLERWEEEFRDSHWFYDTSADPSGYFYIPTKEPPPYGDCRERQADPTLGEWQYEPSPEVGKVAVYYWQDLFEGQPVDNTNQKVQSSLFRTEPAIGIPGYDYLVYLENVSPFNWVEQPLSPEYTLDGKPLIYVLHSKYVVRLPLVPASDYFPVIHAPYTQSVENPTEGQYYERGWRLIADVGVEPYYIVLSLEKSADGIHWQTVTFGQPVILGEEVNVIPTYSPDGTCEEIHWEHTPADAGWTGAPPFEPTVVGQHTITARYFPEGNKCGLTPAERTVSFTVVDPPGIYLTSSVPKETLLIGERMPLFLRLVNLNEQKQLDEIDASIVFVELGKIVEEGSGEVVEIPCWQFRRCFDIPPEPLHDEYWFVFTVAGLSEGKIKLQPKVKYKLNGETAFTEVLGPQYDIQVRGFVDVRLDNVGEWGEEDPGAFMATGGIEQLTLRTCSAGDVLLSWSSDNVELYTDPTCEAEDKVVEADGSMQGCRRATFSPEFPTPANKDHWNTQFRTTRLWAKAVETSSILHGVRVSMAPVSGNAAPDLVKLTSAEATLKSISFVDAGAGYGGDNGHVIKKNSADHQGWGVGEPIEDPVWLADGPDPGSDPDKNEPVCYTRSTDDVGSRLRVEVAVKVEPPGVTFSLLARRALTDYFRADGLISTGADQAVSIVARKILSKKIEKLTMDFSWNAGLLYGPALEVGDTEHVIYQTYAAPLDEVTPQRLEKACVDWAPSVTKKWHAARKIQLWINEGEPPYFDGTIDRRSDIWYMLEENDEPHWNAGDCLSHAMLIQEGLKTMGIESEVGRVYASRDDGNAWEELDYHPVHDEGHPDPWQLRFTTDGLNLWEGTAKLQEDGAWYYFAGAPAVAGAHETDQGASIMLLRTYVLYYPGGTQEYYHELYGQYLGTGEYEPLPDPP